MTNRQQIKEINNLFKILEDRKMFTLADQTRFMKTAYDITNLVAGGVKQATQTGGGTVVKSNEENLS